MFLECWKDIHFTQHSTLKKLNTVPTSEVLHQSTLVEAKLNGLITFNSLIFPEDLLKTFKVLQS